MRRPINTALVLAFLAAPGAALAADGATDASAAQPEMALEGDAQAGEKRYRRQCRQCHGPTGKGVSSYPRLVGNEAEYLVTQLKRYRSGEKIGPNTALMAINARNLKDKDIADLAAFIVSLDAD